MAVGEIHSRPEVILNNHISRSGGVLGRLPQIGSEGLV
jgi:hypothetical protein